MNPRLKAASKRQKLYQGSPCKHCGETTRYTSSSGCVACQRKTSGATNAKIRNLLKGIA